MIGSLRLLLRIGCVALLTITAVLAVAHLTRASVVELSHLAESGDAARVLTLDRLVGDLAAVLLLAAVTGLAVVSGLAMTATLAAARAPAVASVCARVTPPSSRRIMAAVLGLGLAAPGLLEGSALADGPGHAAVCGVARHHDGRGLAGLELPDLPSSPVASTGPADSARQVVVQDGDSLWRIAGRLLPPNAPAADVSTLTWRIYSLNRAAIGDDPDLIHPALTLFTPKGHP
jgi:nucleoid-associated protein YgaU